MSRESPVSEDPQSDMTQILTMVKALRQRNESLQEKFPNILDSNMAEDDFKEEHLDLHPLAEAIWEDTVQEKPLPLVSFDGKSNPKCTLFLSTVRWP